MVAIARRSAPMKFIEPSETREGPQRISCSEPTVPTWNYVAVHAYGRLAFTDDPATLRRYLVDHRLLVRSPDGAVYYLP